MPSALEALAGGAQPPAPTPGGGALEQLASGAPSVTPPKKKKPATVETPPNPRANPLRQALGLIDLPLAATQQSRADEVAALHRQFPILDRVDPARIGTGILAGMLDPLGIGGQEAALIGHGGAHMNQLRSDLRTGGPDAVSENDVYLRKGSLERIIADPTATPQQKALAQQWLEHPYLSGAADFLQEFANPGNALAGEIGGLALRPVSAGVRAARAASPVVNDSLRAFEDVGHTLAAPAKRLGAQLRRATAPAIAKIARTVGPAKALADRYLAAGIPQRGGLHYTGAALAAQAAPVHAEAVLRNRVAALGQDLTPMQAREVQRLSYVDANGERLAQPDPTIPAPAKGASLSDRAAQSRALIKEYSGALNAAGIKTFEEGGLRDPNTYWPMAQQNGHPVYIGQEKPKPGEEPPLPETLAPGELESLAAGRGKGRFKVGLGKTVRAKKGPLLTPEDWADIHPSYDPFYQLAEHYAPAAASLANESTLRGFEALPFLDPATGKPHMYERPGIGVKPATARMSAYRALLDRENPVIFGEDENLAKRAQLHYTERQAHAKAKADAAADPKMRAFAEAHDVDPNLLGTRSLTQRSVTPLTARAREAVLNQKNAARLANSIAKIRGRGYERIEEHIRQQVDRTAAEAQRLTKAVEDAKAAVARGQRAADARTLGEMVKQRDAALKAASDARFHMEEAIARLPVSLRGPGDAALEAMDKAATKPLERSMNAVAAAGRERNPQAALNRVESVGERQTKKAAAAAERVDEQTARLTKPLDRAQARAAGMDAQAAKRIADLGEAYKLRLARTTVAAEFRRVNREYYQRVYGEVKDAIDREVNRTLGPPGYVPEASLGLGSPSGQDKVIDAAIGLFLQQSQKINPAETEQVTKLWKAMQTLSRLARMSIVLFPNVHGVNNLGMAYLAEGGDPATMARILAGKYKPPAGIAEKTFRSGASSESDQALFRAGERAPGEGTPIADQIAATAAKAGRFERLVKPFVAAEKYAGKGYQALNNWLFRTVEQGYAMDMMDRFLRQGMTEGEAALRIRNALGRIDNLSPAEVALHMQQIFYFYPWMKTAINYWTKKGLIDPKWWSAPVAGTRTTNEIQGFDDPSKPFTLTAGKRNGGTEWRRFTLPLPQRVTENVAEAARLPYDFATGDISGFGADVKAPFNYIAGHLNPIGQVVRDLSDVALHGAEKVAPFNMFHADPNATHLQNVESMAGNLAGRVVAPFSRVGEIAQDPLAGGLATILGSFDYGSTTKPEADAEKKARAFINSFSHDAMAAAKANGDGAAVAAIQQRRELLFQQWKKRRLSGRPVPAAPAAPAPVANGGALERLANPTP